jgi:hypothetical protein
MTDVKYYEQGRVAGDWMLVDSRIRGGMESAIVYDASENRWEAWNNGEVVSAACSSREQAIRLLAEAHTRKR